MILWPLHSVFASFALLAQLHSSSIPSVNISVAEEMDGKGPSQQSLTISSQLLQIHMNATGEV